MPRGFLTSLRDDCAHMTVGILSLVAILQAAGSVPVRAAGCDANDRARSLCAVEKQLTDALARNDAAGLSQIYADDFQLINFRGKRLDKTAVLSAITSGALRFDSLTASEVEIRIYGETGVVTGIQHQVAREPGGDGQAHPGNVRFTHIYVLHDGRWRLVSSQITPL